MTLALANFVDEQNGILKKIDFTPESFEKAFLGGRAPRLRRHGFTALRDGLLDDVETLVHRSVQLVRERAFVVLDDLFEPLDRVFIMNLRGSELVRHQVRERSRIVVR